MNRPNRLTGLLGSELPIIMGGMTGGVTNAQLVAAVADAGAFPFVGTSVHSEASLVQTIADIRKRTAKPFGVNLSLFPGSYSADLTLDTAARIAVAHGVNVVETSGRNPAPVIDLLKGELDLTLIHKVARIENAQTAERLGVDAVTIVGYEEGGHPGPDGVGLMVQGRACRKAIDVPLVMGGGIVDGSQMVAALALGADGVIMGTRFVATRESPVAMSIKQRIVDATASDTVVLMATFRNNTRVLRTGLAERALRAEASGASEAEVMAMTNEWVEGNAKNPYMTGDLDGGVIPCGQGSVMVQDLPRVVDQIERMLDEARESIDRLKAVSLKDVAAVPEQGADQ